MQGGSYFSKDYYCVDSSLELLVKHKVHIESWSKLAARLLNSCKLSIVMSQDSTSSGPQLNEPAKKHFHIEFKCRKNTIKSPLSVLLH